MTMVYLVKEIAIIHEANTKPKLVGSCRWMMVVCVFLIIGTKNMGTRRGVRKRIICYALMWMYLGHQLTENSVEGVEFVKVTRLHGLQRRQCRCLLLCYWGSLDMYKYQLQETKGKLFAQFKSGTIDRTFDESDARWFWPCRGCCYAFR